MAPAIRDGDLLTVEPAGRRPFGEGDVVLYPAGGRFRAHRIRRFDVLRGELVCQGDAWFCRPEVVPAASVLGVVTGLGPEASPAPPKRKLAAWRAGLRGRLGRLVRAAGSGGQHVSGLRGAIVLVFRQASEEGRQGSTGKGSQR